MIRGNAADLLTKLDDSKRAVAKLMARENITVQVVAGAPTASFDTVRRVLTIPAWESLTVDQFDMLIGHEVGHALFTDTSYIETMMANPKLAGLMTYFNVIEDARIERKMKNAFPGLARTFYNAYQQFHQDGPIFQGTQDALINPATGRPTPIASMRFIDRINLHYKIGAFCKIPFTAAERVWLVKIDRCGDMQTALDIAKALHKLAKEKPQQQPKPAPKPQPKPEKTPKSEPTPESDSTDDGESLPDADATESGDDSKDSDSTESTESGDDSQDSDSDSDGDKSDSDKDGKSAESQDGEESDSKDGDSDNAGQPQDGETTDSDTDSTSTSEAGESDSDSTSAGESGDDSQDGGDEQSAESDSDSTSAGDGAGSGSGDATLDPEDDPKSETAAAAADALRQLAEKRQQGREEIKHLIFPTVPDSVLKRHTVPAAKWAAAAIAAMTRYDAGTPRKLDNLEAEWQTTFGQTARSMAQEFNRRKNARELQRATSARTGRLDLKRLHQYKFADDLFQRVQKMPNGQSHGIVAIIDGSGSMQSVMADVIDQLMLFAQFAHSCNIPFEAYMFTDRTDRNMQAEYGVTYTDLGDNSVTIPHGVTLVGLVNTVTDKGSFRRQIRACLGLRQRFADYYQFEATAYIPYANLGGTPLYGGMLLMEGVVARMKRTLRLDKIVTLTISDGADGSGLMFKSAKITRGGRVEESFERLGGYSWGPGSSFGIVVRDIVTKKNHVFAEQGFGGKYTMPAGTMMSMIYRIIKERYDATNIYMFIAGRNRQGDILTGVQAMHGVDSEYPSDASAYVTEIAAEGHAVVPGAADLNIVTVARALKMEEQDFEKTDTSAMSQKRIAKEFQKAMASKINHRKFVGAVIPFIA